MKTVMRHANLRIFLRVYSLRPFSGVSVDPALIDTFSRQHNYLRMSLIEKCNLRCVYCMPAGGVKLSLKEELLSFDERLRTIRLFASLGVRKIKFTGGEPLVSKDVADLIEYTTKSTPIQSVGLTTNGLLLSSQLDRLVASGLSHLNVSLDTLVPEKFEKISRRDGKSVARVLSGIYSAIAKQLPVKINCVLMKGVNHDEMKSFVMMTKETALDVRFIELMPFDDNEWSPDKMMSYLEAIDYLKEQVII
jgi:molybdenum cofactor biosynthesis enzyme MoaA